MRKALLLYETLEVVFAGTGEGKKLLVLCIYFLAFFKYIFQGISRHPLGLTGVNPLGFAP
jgi:hypothetical protein